MAAAVALVLLSAWRLGLFRVGEGRAEDPLHRSIVEDLARQVIVPNYRTFAAESGRKLRWRDYGTFVASGVIGVIANTATLVAASYVVPVLAAKLIAVGVSFLVNFSLSHFVVFRPRRERNPDLGMR